MIKVYHFPDGLSHQISDVRYDGNKLRAVVRENLDLYHHVADVATDELEVAFDLTNTIDTNWWTNSGVTFHGSVGMKGPRSTTTGDLLEINDTRFVVAPSGSLPL